MIACNNKDWSFSVYIFEQNWCLTLTKPLLLGALTSTNEGLIPVIATKLMKTTDHLIRFSHCVLSSDGIIDVCELRLVKMSVIQRDTVGWKYRSHWSDKCVSMVHCRIIWIVEDILLEVWKKPCHKINDFGLNIPRCECHDVPRVSATNQCDQCKALVIWNTLHMDSDTWCNLPLIACVLLIREAPPNCVEDFVFRLHHYLKFETRLAVSQFT